MIQVGGKSLTLDEFSAILFKGQELGLHTEAIGKVEENFKFLQQFSSNKLIYGINTGFGPMAQYKVSQENLLQLQYNLIRSHSSGGGNLMSPLLVKAVMIARLNSMIQTFSGIDPALTELLRDLINKNVYP